MTAGTYRRLRPVRADYLASYETHIVGGKQHREYWIPAEQLEHLNQAITGPIRGVAEYRHGQRVARGEDAPERSDGCRLTLNAHDERTIALPVRDRPNTPTATATSG